LCWLALLLIRVAETTTGVTWATIADELDLLTLGTFTGLAGTIWGGVAGLGVAAGPLVGGACRARPAWLSRSAGCLAQHGQAR